MANRVLAYATDAEPTMHESGQEYMEGMWESVTIERSAAGQPGLMIVMERRDGDLMEDQMVVHIKDGRKFLEHVIEWLAVRGPESEARAWDAGRAAGHQESEPNVAERDATLAAIERVRAILSVKWRDGGVPSHWHSQLTAALDGASEPEWEYGREYGREYGDPYVRVCSDVSSPDGHRADGSPYWNYRVVRRRKAGPWLPVEGESK